MDNAFWQQTVLFQDKPIRRLDLLEKLEFSGISKDEGLAILQESPTCTFSVDTPLTNTPPPKAETPSAKKEPETAGICTQGVRPSFQDPDVAWWYQQVYYNGQPHRRCAVWEKLAHQEDGLSPDDAWKLLTSCQEYKK